MSMNDINNAAAAQNALTARMNAFLDTIDADIATRQAAYGALANNLKGVVGNLMSFSGTVDPDDPAPTNVDGGTFKTMRALVDAAPSGAYITCRLMADKSYDLNQSIAITNQHLFIRKIGGGADPILNVLPYETDAHNNINAIVPNGVCGVKFHDIDIRLPTAEPNPAKPWSSARSIVQYQVGMPVAVALSSSEVSGGIAGVNLGVMSNSGAGTSFFAMWTSTLDGPIYGVVDANTGVTTVAKSAATFANGAAATTSATLGNNLLEN